MVKNSRSKRPTQKVAAGGLAGSAVVILVWVMGAFGLDIPSEVAASLTNLAGFCTAYLVREVQV